MANLQIYVKLLVNIYSYTHKYMHTNINTYIHRHIQTSYACIYTKQLLKLTNMHELGKMRVLTIREWMPHQTTSRITNIITIKDDALVQKLGLFVTSSSDGNIRYVSCISRCISFCFQLLMRSAAYDRSLHYDHCCLHPLTLTLLKYFFLS